MLAFLVVCLRERREWKEGGQFKYDFGGRFDMLVVRAKARMSKFLSRSGLIPHNFC